MIKDKRRITLVSRHKQMAQRSWELSADAANRIELLDSFTMLRATVLSPLLKNTSDIERIVFDRSCSEAEYLGFLAELPHEFSGDVVMIRDDDSGFMSATGRGGGRILYALSPEDMEFYLETQRLVQPTEQMQTGVLHFRPRVVAGTNEAAKSEVPADDTATRRK